MPSERAGTELFATRFAGWPALWARALLAGLAALAIHGFVLGLSPPDPATYEPQTEQTNDGLLYAAIVTRMRGGESYYPAAVAEQRARGYPLRPFVTVRLPTLASLVAWLGPIGAKIAFNLLLLGALAATVLRLMWEIRPPLVRYAAICLAAAAGALPLKPDFLVWHEVWAAALMMLALACRSDRRWLVGVLFGMAAVAIRELALPFLAVMAVMAWRDGNRREALAWVGAIGFGLAVIACHAVTVAAAVSPTDLASPGWAQAEGWRLPLVMLSKTSLLFPLPLPAIGLLVPLALLGWLGWNHGAGSRAAFALIGYLAAFCVVGRINNLYWGLLLAPLLPIGFAFAPYALRDLWRAAVARTARTDGLPGVAS